MNSSSQQYKARQVETELKQRPATPSKLEPYQEAEWLEVRISPPWWAHPLVPAAMIFPIALWAAASTSPLDYALWGTRKYLNSAMVETAALLFLAFVFGLFAGSSRLVRNSDPSYQKQKPVLMGRSHLALADKVAHWLFLTALLAYAIWAGSAVLNGARPSHLLDIISLQFGAVSELKSLSRPIGGITTFTQFAPVSMAIWVFLFRIGYRFRKREMGIILGLTLGRAFLYAERLALIEVLLPVVLIVVMVSGKRPFRPITDWAVKLAPLIAFPFLWGVFAVFEYTRSWVFYRDVTEMTYPQFVTHRLLGYYATAINNSGLYQSAMETHLHIPYFSFPALWDFPLVNWALGTPVFNGIEMNRWWMNTLSNFANPEFNNKGTFLIANADLGTFGALVYWFVLGLLLGFLFLLVRQGSLTGLVAYSCVFIGLLELPRIIYWTQGRIVPVVLGVVLFGAFYSKKPGIEDDRYPLKKAPNVVQVGPHAEVDSARKRLANF